MHQDQSITLPISPALLAKARQHAAEQQTTLEALLIEHLTILADRAGRHVTLREQMYVDYRSPLGSATDPDAKPSNR
jgi:hypothetical protein